MAEPDDLRRQADELESNRRDEAARDADKLREEADAREVAKREQDEADAAREAANKAGA